jgi:flagellar protein FlbD
LKGFTPRVEEPVEGSLMIILTRLDGHPIALNEDLLVFAEKTPDTVITMTSGHRLMVKETLDEVVTKVAEFRQRAGPLEVAGAIHHG